MASDVHDIIEIQAGTTAEAFQKLEHLLTGMLRQIEHPQLKPEQWKDTVDILESLHEQYFVNQTDPTGQSWTPLAPFTVRMKGHSRILFEFGDLMASLTKSGHSMAVRRFQGDAMEFGTNRSVAARHQEGEPESNLPRREHTGLGEQNIDTVAEVIADTAVQLMFQFMI